MERITPEQAVENKMTFSDLVKHYKPKATKEEVEYVIWEETCYPFDNYKTVEQIGDYFLTPPPNSREE